MTQANAQIARLNGRRVMTRHTSGRALRAQIVRKIVCRAIEGRFLTVQHDMDLLFRHILILSATGSQVLQQKLWVELLRHDDRLCLDQRWQAQIGQVELVAAFGIPSVLPAIERGPRYGRTHHGRTRAIVSHFFDQVF